MSDEIIQLNKDRLRGHKFINVVSTISLLAGFARFAYEHLVGGDAVFAKEAVAIGILGGALMYFGGHMLVDFEINEKIAQLKKRR
ncbi:hypothetical protein HYS82_02780 [Candidatus Amesbacteria bacterium]|nr:hypothetical protein [Candidatus Amesbacteria bacterium]MBI2587315.1 hypothetical protein [Candidatus Amesbacteria bacterium]